jgi:hypothetical protein
MPAFFYDRYENFTFNLPVPPMKSGRIPLLVGVTGHRDLRDEDLPRLRSIVGKIFADLKAAYTSSPIILLSSLAEGADRLVAQVALEQEMGLIVPLPMAVKDYRIDFETKESQDEFTALLKKAEMVFVPPGVPGVGPAEPGQDTSRSCFYARAGHYIVQHCHILLALWDGDQAEKTGGTSQVVHQKQYGLPFTHPPDWAILDPPESGTVFHVVTPRKSNPSPPGAFDTRKTYANASEAESEKKSKPEAIFLSLLARADAFNRDVLFLRKEHETEFQKSLSYIQPGGEMGELDPSFQRLLGQFAAADALAIFFQQKRYRSLKWLCTLIVPTSLSLAAYHAAGAGLRLQPFLCVAGFWLSVLAAMAVHTQARRSGSETKHLDYRALAEGLRVLFFWRLAEIRDDIGAQYLRKHWSEVDWIRLAIRASDLILSSQIEPVKVEACVLKHWMIDQREYFKKAGLRHRRLAEAHEKWAKRLVIGGLTLAAVMFAAHLDYCFFSPSMAPWLQTLLHTLSLVVVLLLASAGAVAAVAEKLAYAQLSKQYVPMFRLFEGAAEKYEKCLDPLNLKQARSIMWRLGHEALRENGDWVLLYRERPMEMKIG